MTAAVEHWTATVEVTKTTRPAPAPAPTGSYDRRIQVEPKPNEREVDQVARLVIRADSLDALREKVAGHIALV